MLAGRVNRPVCVRRVPHQRRPGFRLHSKPSSDERRHERDVKSVHVPSACVHIRSSDPLFPLNEGFGASRTRQVRFATVWYRIGWAFDRGTRGEKRSPPTLSVNVVQCDEKSSDSGRRFSTGQSMLVQMTTKKVSRRVRQQMNGFVTRCRNSRRVGNTIPNFGCTVERQACNST